MTTARWKDILRRVFLTLNFVYPNETGDSDEIPLNAKVLTTNVTPSGTGRIERSVPGPEYFEGTVVTLTALPEPGTLSFFSHWAGDVPVGSSNENPLTITMNAHRTITAVFDAYPPNDLHSGSGASRTARVRLSPRLDGTGTGF